MATTKTKKRAKHTAEVYQGKDGAWRYRVKAANGEKIAPSQTYYSKGNAKRAIARNYPDAEVVVVD